MTRKQTTRFQILGTGHSESLRFWNCNALVETPSIRILIDCGHTIKYALRDVGMSLDQIDAVYVSHVHGDHVFGLERLAYESRFVTRKRIRLFMDSALESDVWDRTLRGSLGSTSEGAHDALSDFFDIEYTDSRTFTADGVAFEAVPVRHTPGKPTFGLLVNDNIFYTSDTNPIPDIIDTLPASTIFHDVSLKDTSPVHSSLNELVSSYSPEVRKRMYLMGYEDNVEEFLPVIEEQFAGIAKQGQIVVLD